MLTNCHSILGGELVLSFFSTDRYREKISLIPSAKGGLISKGILTLVLLPKKGAKLLIFLSRKICMKFKFSAQEIDLAPFVGNGIRVEIPSEIKPPLTCVPFVG